MRTKKVIHAFVTSTLPISYFLSSEFDGIIIIHSTQDVYLSYQAAQISNENLVINEIPPTFFRGITYLFNIINSATEILVFHECCWPILDILLILLGSKVTHNPIVTLNSYRFLKSEETSFNSWFKFFSNYNFAKRIYLSIMNLAYGYFFHHAQCTDDGGKVSLRIPVLKEKFKKKWIVSPPYHTTVPRSKFSYNQSTKINTFTNNVLILCATEPVNNQQQLLIYNKIIEIYVTNNFTVSFKDHPRNNARLGLENSLATEINPLIPSQLLVEKYDVVIGAFSTSLAEVFGIKRTISIGKLMNLPETVFIERIRHLQPFSGFAKIEFIEDFNSLLHHKNF